MIGSKCIGCGKRHYRTNSEYCMERCEIKQKNIKVNCKQCGKIFTPTNFQNKYCSRNCKCKAVQEANLAYRIKNAKPHPFDIFKRDNFRCVYCGASSHDGYTLSVDHVYPISKGGKHDIFNLTTACASCNSRKSDKLLSIQQTLDLWDRNYQRDVESGLVNKYSELKEYFDEYFKYRVRDAEKERLKKSA